MRYLAGTVSHLSPRALILSRYNQEFQAWGCGFPSQALYQLHAHHTQHRLSSISHGFLLISLSSMPWFSPSLKGIQENKEQRVHFYLSNSRVSGGKSLLYRCVSNRRTLGRDRWSNFCSSATHPWPSAAVTLATTALCSMDAMGHYCRCHQQQTHFSLLPSLLWLSTTIHTLPATDRHKKLGRVRL